jgi:hypothetical protein
MRIVLICLFFLASCTAEVKTYVCKSDDGNVYSLAIDDKTAILNVDKYYYCYKQGNKDRYVMFNACDTAADSYADLVFDSISGAAVESVVHDKKTTFSRKFSCMYKRDN